MLACVSQSPFGPWSVSHAVCCPSRTPRHETGSATRVLAGLSLALTLTVTVLPMPLSAQIVTALDWTDRTRITSYIDEQRQLERDLLAVGQRAEAAEFIESKGFLITAILEEAEHSLVYEVVKDGRTHEVRLGFERPNGPADAIDVTTNLWLAPTTRQAMDDPDFRPDALVLEPELAERVKDSNRLGAWEERRQALETSMPAGRTLEEYKEILRAAGYEITAASDTLPTHADYEIVRDGESYEVQIQRDITTGRAISVEVEADIWKAEATARALKDE